MKQVEHADIFFQNHLELRETFRKLIHTNNEAMLLTECSCGRTERKQNKRKKRDMRI